MVVKDPAMDQLLAQPRERSSRSTAPPDREPTPRVAARRPATNEPKGRSMDREVGPIETGLQKQSSSDQQQKKHRLKSRFQVVRKLGQGTYGKVQLAVNKETGQEVRFSRVVTRMYACHHSEADFDRACISS